MFFYVAYITLITLLLLLNHYSKDSKKLFERLSYVIIILVSGLRYKTGYDYDTYTWLYNAANPDFDGELEFGFVLLMKALRFFDLDVTFLFLIMAFLTYVFLYLGLKKLTRHTGIALIVFMLIPGLYLNTLSIIRQELAIVIALYAFSALTEKNFLKYCLLMLLGSSFHYSCILIVFAQLAIWRLNDFVKLWYYYFALVFSLVLLKTNGLSFVLNYFSGFKYGAYLEGDSVSFFKVVIMNLFIIIQLFFYKDTIKRNHSNKYLFSFSVLAVVVINTFSSLLIVTRIAYYFRIFEAVLIAEFVYSFRKKILRESVLAVVYIYYTSMFIYALENDIQADGHGQPKMIPYQSVFFKRE